MINKERLLPRFQAAVFAVLAALVVLMLYARALGFDYVWDDLNYFGAFNHYLGVDGLRRAFTEPFVLSANYYRPLAVASFAFSGEATVQHVINVTLHVLNTVLVFYCARALMPHKVAGSRLGLWAPLLGALAFAVHPVAVEPVAWVSGRFDALMCSFVLGTCLAALGGELTRRRLALVCMLFFAAMCSKESAAGLFVALPFLLWLKYRLANNQGGQVFIGVLVRLLGALVLALVLYVVVRVAVLGALFPKVVVTFSSRSWADKFNVAALAVAEFAKLMLNPWSHSAPLHPFKYEVGSGGVLASTLAVVACVLVLLVGAALKKPRLNVPLALLAALGMLWPALHFFGIPNGANLISDRYALAPLALLLAALAAVAAVWLAQRAGTALGKRMAAYSGAVCVLWIGALAAHSRVTLPIWRSEMTFWPFVHQQVPASEMAHKRYIGTLIDQMRWHEADEEMQRMWQQHPDAPGRMRIGDVIDLMIVRSKSGDYAGALGWAEMVESNKEKLQALQPRERGVFYGVYGMMEADAGHWERAVYYYSLAIQASPTDMDNMFKYAQALFMTGRKEKAEEVFARALAGSTKDVRAWALEWRKTWEDN